MFQESNNLFKAHTHERINSRRDKDGWLVEIGIRENKTSRASKYYVIDSTGDILLFDDPDSAWNHFKK